MGTRNIKTIKAVALLSSLLFVVGCNSDTIDLKERTITPVTPTGGEARSAGGELTLSFSAGALSANQDIVIETYRNRTVPRGASAVYELGPDGLQFSEPVTMAVQLETFSTDEIYAIANVDGDYPEIIEDSVWDPATRVVSATLPHFSSWAVVSIYIPCGGKSCNDACTICDPMNPNCVEPPPASKACNRSGLCVEQAIVMCPVPMDAGTPTLDAGSMPTPDAGFAMDAGNLPDTGTSTPTTDAGVADTGPAACTDTFQQNPQAIVDVLLVVDQSGSMAQEQMQLASSFPLILQTLVDNSADFHIAITGVDPNNAGQFIGTPAVLNPLTPNLSQEFTDRVTGSLFGGIEQGLENSQAALTSTIGQSQFLRNDSWLTVIYLSDEEDQSPDPVADYVQFFQMLRPGRVQVNTIVGDVPNGCQGPTGSAQAGPRYDDVRQATGGVFDSICSGQWSQALTELGPTGFGYEDEFVLSQPAPGGVLSVNIDGNTIPSVDSGGVVLWTYDAATQTIRFTQYAIPEPGATIVVTSGC